MRGLKFGTDGIRGIANKVLTPEFVFRLGLCAGHLTGTNKVVVGRDTRRSGTMLEAALASGFASAGLDVDLLGIAPTGAISYVTRTGPYVLGCVISASHNPAPDNGIKFFDGNGTKLDATKERAIEELIVSQQNYELPTGLGIGLISPIRPISENPYMDFLEAIVPERLDGMRIAVDGSNGSAYQVGPEILRRLGAEVITTAVVPDGMNINEECGATSPHRIQILTVESGASIGVAFDGDADRAVFSDDKGELINGDRTLAIWSAHWRKHGKFDPPIVVGTVMSNGGYEQYLIQNGIKLERTDVGDKYVSARMVELGAKAGGEQSGHLIFSERGPTGDGLITALELLRILKREGRPASQLMQDFSNWPQLLVNVTVKDRKGWSDGAQVSDALNEGKNKLGSRGRLNVRPSGTQEMLRVMVEADDAQLRDEVADLIVAAMQSELSGKIYSRVDLTHALGD